jgi:rubrerythrin
MNEIVASESRLTTRRALLGGATKATLSAAAIALLGGVSARSFAGAKESSGDVAILNVALGLEFEAIAAYQIGAESGLLKKPALDVAVLFQSHHKAHRDALIATIGKLGGTPVADRSKEEYLRSTKLNVGAIKSDTDVLKLAQRLELGATNAYLGVIPSLGDHELAKVAARLAADETLHYTALTLTLGGSLPGSALSFGA